MSTFSNTIETAGKKQEEEISKWRGLTIGLLIGCSLCSLSVYVTGLVIAVLNKDAECAKDFNIISVPNWLLTNSIVGLIFTVTMLCIFVICLVLKWYTFMAVARIISIVLIFIFAVIWSIIGAFELFKYSDCYEPSYSLWAMSLASLIFLWFGLCNLCTLKRFV